MLVHSVVTDFKSTHTVDLVMSSGDRTQTLLQPQQRNLSLRNPTRFRIPTAMSLPRIDVRWEPYSLAIVLASY